MIVVWTDEIERAPLNHRGGQGPTVCAPTLRAKRVHRPIGDARLAVRPVLGRIADDQDAGRKVGRDPLPKLHE